MYFEPGRVGGRYLDTVHQSKKTLGRELRTEA
jgi:hypothetical protein